MRQPTQAGIPVCNSGLSGKSSLTTIQEGSTTTSLSGARRGIQSSRLDPPVTETGRDREKEKETERNRERQTETVTKRERQGDTG